MKKERIYFLSALTLFLIIIISVFLFIQEEGVDINKIRDFVNSFGVWAPIVYILLYILFSLTTGTAAFMSVLAGAIFGIWKGWIIDMIAGLISSILAFNITRYFHGKFLKNRVEKKENKSQLQNLVHFINKRAEKKGFITMVYLRFSFVPYILLSYAAGLVKKLRLRDFIAATVLTNIFGSFVFVFLGASFLESIPLFIIALLLFILFVNIPRIMSSKKKL